MVATPSLGASLFGSAIVYVCAHSTDGCMGFIINKPHQMTLDELLINTDEPGAWDAIPKNACARILQPLRTGGPVDEGRGFILHSSDYELDSTISITKEVSLTASMTALYDVAAMRGPQRAAVSLGYANWGANQLESEISKNYWLTLHASSDLIFSEELDDKYDRALAMIGIHSRASYVAEPGHA